MGRPVVHFEITGKDAAKLRTFYGELFDWEFDTDAPVAEPVSEAGNYGFVKRYTTSVKNPGAELIVANFTDPEGHLIGLAGPE